MERTARKGLRLGWTMVAAVLFAASTSNAQKPEEKKPAAAPAAAAPAAKPAAGAPAAPGAPMPAPKPAPELDQLKFFLGKWKCEGKAMASPMGPEHAVKGSAEAKMDND